MICQLFSMTDEQRVVLSSMSVITKDDIKKLFESFAVGKIKKVRVGKLHITDVFFPKFKETPLAGYEEQYAFFAIEKHKTSFFSRADYRIFIWPLGSNSVFAVPMESVSFEKPLADTKAPVLLEERINEHSLFKTKEYGREHECIFEKMCLKREFALEKAKAVCTKDFVIHHFRWTNPDGWVREHFTLQDDEAPMFLLRNEPKIPGGLRLSYPRRPDLWGHHIDEN